MNGNAQMTEIAAEPKKPWLDEETKGNIRFWVSHGWAMLFGLALATFLFLLVFIPEIDADNDERIERLAERKANTLWAEGCGYNTNTSNLTMKMWNPETGAWVEIPPQS